MGFRYNGNVPDLSNMGFPYIGADGTVQYYQTGHWMECWGGNNNIGWNTPSDHQYGSNNWAYALAYLVACWAKACKLEGKYNGPLQVEGQNAGQFSFTITPYSGGG